MTVLVIIGITLLVTLGMSNNWNNVVGDFRDEYVITMV